MFSVDYFVTPEDQFTVELTSDDTLITVQDNLVQMHGMYKGEVRDLLYQVTYSNDDEDEDTAPYIVNRVLALRNAYSAKRGTRMPEHVYRTLADAIESAYKFCAQFDDEPEYDYSELCRQLRTTALEANTPRGVKLFSSTYRKTELEGSDMWA